MTTNGTPAQQPAEQQAYDREAWRFTISLDVHAEGAIAASTLVMAICQRLAQLATDPLGGQALHDAMGGRVLNIVCFNDATPVAEPVDPRELTMMQDAVRALQSGDPDALAGLAGMLGMADQLPPADPPAGGSSAG